MPLLQVRNPSAQELGSTDHLDVEDRNFAAEWYDNAGGQTYTLGTSPFTINLTTERINSAPTIFSLASNIITISEAGLYLLHAQVMVQQNGGSSSVVSRFWLEQDPATTVFSEVVSTRSYIHQAPLSSAIASNSLNTLLQVGLNYRYRLRLEEAYGSSPLITVANGTKLTLTRLFKNG